ncbi:heterokaryon incompatibility protein-domain-containing protein [Corynascus similis CBS 632.67]
MEQGTLEYASLPEPDSFRLLLLEPSEDYDADLRGQLIHTTIREREDDIYTGYLALSYVWGDLSSSLGGLIHLDHGQALPLTASLDAALRSIRHTSETCRVWADALCINQANFAERNEQVGLMRAIYSLAAHTVIFLGPLTFDAEWVFCSINRLRQQKQYAVKGEIEDVEAGMEKEERLRRLRDVLDRTWFTRTWTLQELVLSHNPVVQCGCLRVRWSDLCSFAFTSSTPESPTGASSLSAAAAPDSATGVMRAMETARREYHRGDGSVMLDLLSARRAAGASDPRDLVYGLLGMVSTTAKPLPADFVDYALPVEQVYFKTAVHILESASWPLDIANPMWNGLELLLSAAEDGIPAEQRQEGLPSWVPDWRRAKSILPLPASSGELSWRLQQGILGGDPRPWCVTVEEPPALVCGLCSSLLVVQQVSPVFPAPSTVPQELLQQCRAAFATFRINRTGRDSDVESAESRRIGVRKLFTALVNFFKAIEPPVKNDSDAHGSCQDRFCNLLVEWVGWFATYNPILLGQREAAMLQIIRTYFVDEGTPSPLQGRRMAFLSNLPGSTTPPINYGELIAVVPASTRPRDLCVSLPPSPRLYIVREEYNVDSALDQRVMQSAEHLKIYARPNGSPVPEKPRTVAAWGRLLGECYAVLSPLGSHGVSEEYIMFLPFDHVIALL